MTFQNQVAHAVVQWAYSSKSSPWKQGTRVPSSVKTIFWRKKYKKLCNSLPNIIWNNYLEKTIFIWWIKLISEYNQAYQIHTSCYYCLDLTLCYNHRRIFSTRKPYSARKSSPENLCDSTKEWCEQGMRTLDLPLHVLIRMTN